MNSVGILLLLASLCTNGTVCEFRPLDDTHIMVERTAKTVNYYCLSWRKTTGSVEFKFREIIFSPSHNNRSPSPQISYRAIEFCRKDAR